MMYDLVVDADQELHIWGMGVDDNHIQIAFDSGDNGFIKLTNDQARELVSVVDALLPAKENA